MFLLFCSFFNFKIFRPIYEATEVIIPYGIHPFDICTKNPELWQIIKTTYIFTSSISFFLIGHFVYTRIILKLIQFLKNIKSNSIEKNNKNKIANKNIKSNNFKKSLFLKVGKDENKNIVYIPESGLYQNFLITL